MFRKATKGSDHATDQKETTRITDTAPCQKSVRLRVGHHVIAPVRAAVLAEFQKQATLPGFRKGKSPANLVERQYAKEIQDETLHRVTKQAFEQAAREHDLKPVGPFEVTTADFSEAAGLTLEATVEIEPSFTLGAYKGITLKREPAEVTAQDIERALSQLQESMAQMVPSGQEGQAKVRQLPTVDDELAKDLGFESLAKLKEHVEAKLREQKRAAQAQALESALYEELLKRHAFEVPARLVSHQTERLTSDFKVRLLLSGVVEDKVEQELAKFTDQLRTSAAQRVKLGFILDRIADQESVSVTQDELVGKLWQFARRWKKDPAEVRQTFDAQGLWPSVASSLRQEKTVAWLLSVAAIEDAPAGQPTV
jgi:FKBP-type peptidyl-prolyl cis-trans isomerase (trigger factor)